VYYRIAHGYVGKTELGESRIADVEEATEQNLATQQAAGGNP